MFKLNFIKKFTVKSKCNFSHIRLASIKKCPMLESKWETDILITHQWLSTLKSYLTFILKTNSCPASGGAITNNFSASMGRSPSSFLIFSIYVS